MGAGREGLGGRGADWDGGWEGRKGSGWEE